MHHNLAPVVSMLIIMMKMRVLFIWLILQEFKNHRIKGGDSGLIKEIFADVVAGVGGKELVCSLLEKELKPGTLTREPKSKNGDKEG